METNNISFGMGWRVVAANASSKTQENRHNLTKLLNGTKRHHQVDALTVGVNTIVKVAEDKVTISTEPINSNSILRQIQMLVDVLTGKNTYKKELPTSNLTRPDFKMAVAESAQSARSRFPKKPITTKISDTISEAIHNYEFRRAFSALKKEHPEEFRQMEALSAIAKKTTLNIKTNPEV